MVAGVCYYGYGIYSFRDDEKGFLMPINFAKKTRGKTPGEMEKEVNKIARASAKRRKEAEEVEAQAQAQADKAQAEKAAAVARAQATAQRSAAEKKAMEQRVAEEANAQEAEEAKNKKSMAKIDKMAEPVREPVRHDDGLSL